MASKDPPTSHEWHKYAQTYDPIRIGSIDGTDTEPHDRAIVRALHSRYRPPQFAAAATALSRTAPCAGEARHTVFIARLHPETDESELRSAIEKSCSSSSDRSASSSSSSRIRHLRLVRDIRTDASRRYAFVVCDSSRTARDVIRRMHGTELRGQRLLVTEECERLLPGWRPRRLGGGFGGRRESGQLRFGCVDRPFQRPVEMAGGAKWQQSSRSQRRRSTSRDKKKPHRARSRS